MAARASLSPATDGASPHVAGLVYGIDVLAVAVGITGSIEILEYGPVSVSC